MEKIGENVDNALGELKDFCSQHPEDAQELVLVMMSKQQWRGLTEMKQWYDKAGDMENFVIEPEMFGGK